MARFVINIDIPDERQDELIAALRHHFGQVGSPARDRTPQELLAGVKGDAVEMMKGWYREWRLYQRENDDLPIT